MARLFIGRQQRTIDPNGIRRIVVCDYCVLFIDGNQVIITIYIKQFSILANIHFRNIERALYSSLLLNKQTIQIQTIEFWIIYMYKCINSWLCDGTECRNRHLDNRIGIIKIYSIIGHISHGIWKSILRQSKNLTTIAIAQPET